MKKNIALIPGDGIGVEIMVQARNVLEIISTLYNHHFYFDELLVGGCAIDAYGDCLPKISLESCKNSDSVLLGAVGGPKWDNQPHHNRPEHALLTLRKELGLFANIRPAKLFDEFKDSSPLKNSILQNGVDFIVVRELVGGLYFGEHKIEEVDGERIGFDVMSYSVSQIEAIARVAFDIASLRRKNVVSVDKANVLSSSKLWREIVEYVSRDYKDITLTHMYVDNAAMQICRNPSQFDVILTENMFGDILSDESSVIAGTLGVLPSASLSNIKDLCKESNHKFGMYEPIHGSAPDIAMQDKANPIGMILSAAMMLELSFGLKNEALAIQNAVYNTLSQGYRTGDIMSEGKKLVGCKEMGERICSNLL